jgi:hypothetical protein
MTSNEYYEKVNENFDRNFLVLKKLGFVRTKLSGDDGAVAYVMVKKGEFPKNTITIPTVVLGFFDTDRMLDYYGIQDKIS